MRKYCLAAVVVALSLPGLPAQDTGAFPDGTVGVPYFFDLGSDLAAVSQEIAQIGQGFSFSYSFGATNTPPGLTLQANGIFSGTPTTAGSFQVSITLHEVFVYQGQTIFDETFPFPETLQINGTAGGGPATLDPGGLNFPFPPGTTAAVSQGLSLSNPSNQPKTFTVSATTASGGSWLSASPGSGALAPFSSSAIQVTVSPAGLLPGTYTGVISVKVSPTGESFAVPVNAVFTSSQQSIVLSEAGLRFQAVKDGGAPLSQSLAVFDGGPGSLTFSAAASTTSGGNWLSVSPNSGISSSTLPATLAVSVNPAGLAPGNYYGQINVSATSAANSPQSITIVLNVSTLQNNPGLSVSTTGLIFVSAAKGTSPGLKSATISNPSPTPVMFATSTSSATPGIFSATSLSSTVNTGQPVTVQVQANTSGLGAGVYLGELDISGSDGAFRRVTLLLVVTPGAAGAAGQATTAAACAPQKLLPIFTQLGSGFSVPAGWPVPLELTVVDDCGNFFTGGGAVVASFTSSDPAVSLNSLKDGRWVATWQPRVSAAQVTITARASETQPSLQGTAQLGGGLVPNPLVPIIGAGGVVSAASYAKQAPISPGGFISIFGSNLSGGMFASSKLPLSTQLGGTQVTLGGKVLPLLITSGTQINAVLPFDVPANSVQQLVVQQNSAVSLPEPVAIAASAPGVFALNQQGSGDGIIDDYPPNAHFFQVDSTHPASAGDIIVIYCAGLGAVNPPVPAGTASPASPPSITVNPVTVTIGGKSVRVDFSGLTPGFAGLYQINTAVPSGLASGAQPVVISVAGQQSPPVTLNVR